MRIVTAREQVEMLTPWRVAMPTWYHLTNESDFSLKPDVKPKRPYGLGDWENPGVFLTQRPHEWAFEEGDKSWSGDRPYLAEIDAPDNLHELPGAWYDPDSDRPTDKFPGSEETFIPAEQFHHLRVKQVRPRNATQWKHANIMGTEGFGNEVHYKPGPHSHSAVAEDEHGNYLGGMEWAKYPSVITRGKPIEWVETHPAARNRGIATGLFNWAKENVDPKLEHSTHVTPAGKGWAQSMGFKPDRTKGQKWTKVKGYW